VEKLFQFFCHFVISAVLAFTVIGKASVATVVFRPDLGFSVAKWLSGLFVSILFLQTFLFLMQFVKKCGARKRAIENLEKEDSFTYNLLI